MLKKVLCCLIALGLTASLLAGCGAGNETEPENTAPVTRENEADNQETANEAENAATGDIRVFVPEVTTWPDYMPVLEQFKKDFPDINVDFGSVKNDQYVAQITTKIAANDIPDIFFGWVGIAQFANHINRGYVMDLTSESFINRLTDAGKKAVTYNDKVYGVPINVQVIGTLYNKKIYKELGLSVPKTWEEFTANCEAIKKAGKTPLALGVKDNYVTQMLPYTLWPSVTYGKNMDFENQRIEGKVKYDSPEWKKPLEMAVDLYNKGYTNTGVLGISYDQQLEMIATEKAVMLNMGDWCVDTIKKINPDIQLGFFPTPPPAGTDLVLESQPGGVYMIAKDTKAPEAAKKFVEVMLTDPEYYYKWNKSPIQSLKDAPVPTDETYKDFAEAYSNAKAVYPFINQYWINASMGDTFCRAMQDVYAGAKTVDDVAKTMDEAFEKVLPAYLDSLKEQNK